MVVCEDKNCEEDCLKRIVCFHCGLKVCPWCWHHIHRCEPGHGKAECKDYKAYKKHGQEWIDRLRARGEAVEHQ